MELRVDSLSQSIIVVYFNSILFWRGLCFVKVQWPGMRKEPVMQIFERPHIDWEEVDRKLTQSQQEQVQDRHGFRELLRRIVHHRRTHHLNQEAVDAARAERESLQAWMRDQYRPL